MTENTIKTTKELENEYRALIAEKRDLTKLVNDAEAAKRRLQELYGKYGCAGDIEIKEQEIVDSRFPVYTIRLMTAYRIVDVDEEYISIKRDGLDMPVVRYERYTGRQESTKDGFRIDQEEAIRIWEEFESTWKKRK